jgi:cytochrome c oxidase subunit 2
MQAFRRRAAVFALSFAAFVLVAGVLLAGAAHAQQPRPWEMGMQPAGSPVKEQVIRLHDLVMVIITLITLFVAVLLGIVMWRFRADRHPNPSRTSHNTVLEVAWTVVPVLILVVIAIPSFRLVYYEDRTRDADLTIKVLGQQWQWVYDYPDKQDLHFTSYYVHDEDLKPGQLRLLDVDNQLVVPVGKNIRLLLTSDGVIHSFFIPSLGVQRYAIPGRTIETWVRVDRPGVYYGECNQICGEGHSRMPIAIKAVPEAEFDAWVTEAKVKFKDAQAEPAAPATPQLVAQIQR